MAKLKGSEQITVVVGGPESQVLEILSKVQGVNQVAVMQKGADDKITYSVDSSLHADVTRELAKVIVNNNMDLYELKKSEMTLEEIFLRLTTQEEEVYN